MKKIKIFIKVADTNIEEEVNKFLSSDNVTYVDLKINLEDEYNFSNYTLIYEETPHCDNCSSYFKKSNACTYFGLNITEDLMRRCEEKRGGSDGKHNI